ncbi:PBP2_NikA_DppA_OppA_like [Peptoniphilus sp. ING2-D1G]|nr:PBP2_NikA_DppA_OppA_like [Peptoniphilus sp. ING2-D1G]
MKNLYKKLTLLFALMFLLTACGGNKAENTGGNTSGTGTNSQESADSGEAKIIKYASQYPDMDSLDVHKYTTTDVILPARNICEPLLQYDENNELKPLLLEEMPTTEDGKIYNFKLAKGIKFHDGTELTSKDVEFTFNRIFNPETQNLNTWLVDMIKGAKDMLEGKADTLSGFTVIDDYNFTIELEMPYAPFLSVLSCEQNMIYPKDACEAAGDKWGIETFIGTGPFKLEEFVGKDYMHALRYDDYHGEPAKVDELYIYNMDANTSAMEYEAGNLNMVQVETKMVEPYKTDEFKDQLVRNELMGIISLNLNVNMPPLDNQTVRQAISYAIDKDAIIDNYLQGNAVPAKSIIPPGIMAYPEDREANKYDPEKAKELLTQAGFPDGIDLETYVVEKDEAADIAVVLQEQLKASNINLKINLVDQATYVDIRKSGEVQCPILTWYKDMPDPDNFTYTFFYSEGSQLFSSNWNDPESDELMIQGRSLPEEERLPVYQKLEKILVEDKVATVPLYNPIFYYLKAPELQGVEYFDSMIRFKNADIVK